jgi:anaerobic ribonucleoside-triphosphate reductase activating protein
MKNGIEVSVDEIIKLIPQKISGITISGGEPFDQAEELEELLRHASKRKLHRLVYTGYRYEELAASKIASVNQSLALTDMLVDGAYDYRIQPTHSLSGSGNQRMLQLKEGNIIKEIEATESVFHNGELIIDRNGNITATGFFDSMMRMQHEY